MVGMVGMEGMRRGMLLLFSIENPLRRDDSEVDGRMGYQDGWTDG